MKAWRGEARLQGLRALCWRTGSQDMLPCIVTAQALLRLRAVPSHLGEVARTGQPIVCKVQN